MSFDERFILNSESKTNIIYNEHLIRYNLASGFVKGKDVLDVACGSGFGAKILAKAGARKIVAVDIDKETIKKAKKDNSLDNIIYKEGNTESLNEGDNSFDIISSFETIEHLKNPDKYLNELKRVVREEGIVFISTPNKEVFREKNPFHFKEFEKQEFISFLKSYFKSVLILEQANGLASCIKGEKRRKESILAGSEFGKPLYFIAVCSNKELREEDVLEKNLVSINSLALKNLYNNPALRAANSIYRIFKKIF